MNRYLVEHAYDVPPRHCGAIVIDSPVDGLLDRIVMAIVHAGPPQRLRAYRGRNVVSPVTARTQLKRQAEARRKMRVTDVHVRNMAVFAGDAVPIDVFDPIAFDLGISQRVRENDRITIRVAGTYADRYTLRIRIRISRTS